MRFLIIYTRGPNWREGVILHNQPSIPEHAVYGQQNQSLIMLAGPFADGSGGAIVVDVESEKEAKELAENDPAVLSGVFYYQIKEWKKSLIKSGFLPVKAIIYTKTAFYLSNSRLPKYY